MMSKTGLPNFWPACSTGWSDETHRSKDHASTETAMSARMGVGSWIILIVLLSLLVATVGVIYLGWTLGNGTDVPTSGYAAMVFGVIISLV